MYNTYFFSSMAKQTPPIITLLSLLILFFMISITTEGTEKSSYGYDSRKLFVFGDSYVDTGNFLNSPSYKPPYGITFPHHPSGRFSDGRVLTDYIASSLNIKSPAPYSLRNSSDLQFGINFAYGGTGVFDTSLKGPNMTTQIDTFEELIKQNIYNKSEIDSSFALVSVAGNDYFQYFFKDGKSLKDVLVFGASIIKQLSINLKRIHSIGINKIAIGLQEPTGCLPVITKTYDKCNDTINLLFMKHNEMLLQAVEDLNKESESVFVATLDLYKSFLSVIETMQKNSTVENVLRPCCVPESSSYECGSVDERGQKKYSLCDKPELSFFWDAFHPTQNGWDAVYKMVRTSLSL
ncbi:GDSL esterase/lipase At5g03610-like isoform X2 [Vicia villosa]|uniref:GDSL esterase/lipase At5g03610-like isoform X2 n=1 Tax=Vicia villosa TaxID=3911 RepID=UPI00273ACFCE|nr:GDSL esterase/lipase At5g03610-like isoform X2 [Vicia villosa]